MQDNWSIVSLVKMATHSTRRIGDDILFPNVRPVIHPKHQIRYIFTRRGNDDLFRTSNLDMHTGLFSRRHFPRRLHDVIRSGTLPVYQRGIPLREKVDNPAPEQETGRGRIVGCSREEVGVIFRRNGDFTRVETWSMSRVMSDGSDEMFEGKSSVIDRDKVDVGSL